ncbi:MAG: pyruvate formate lyase-activating protein [Clostridia bacterium]|nr:pyruvate formate lyase-activating protein [Clostridia bacterium]
MLTHSLTARIHSFQSLGTVDGPGVRAVIFMQGCPLRCVCCHNPDTWDPKGGTPVTVDELLGRIERCRKYFGKHGGVTVSGGEPLLQAEFITALFTALRARGIHTALDTSGCILNDTTKALLRVTDLVLLDYKYTNAEDYRRYTGMEQATADRFLSYLQEQNIPTWLRYVYIPTLNDNDTSLTRLCAVKDAHRCVEKVELLPFRRLCIEKYDRMGIPFPLRDTPEPPPAEIDALKQKFPQLQ